MSSHCLTLLSNFQLHSEKRKIPKKMRERENPYSAHRDLWDPTPSPSWPSSGASPPASSNLDNNILLSSSWVPQAATCQNFCISDILCLGLSFFTAWWTLGLSDLTFNVFTDLSTLKKNSSLVATSLIKSYYIFKFTLYLLISLLSFYPTQL